MSGPSKITERLDWAEPPSPIPWWVWIALVFALTGSAWLVHRQRQLALAAAPPPVRSPGEIAREALGRLRALLGEDNYLSFVIEVSRILRVYLQDRFGLRAPHRSTEEFLTEASESELLSAEQQEGLADFLRHCDLVKFARRRAALDRMERLFRAAEQFVDDTAPAPPPADQPAVVAVS